MVFCRFLPENADMELSAKQEKALACLLSQPTLADAAKAAGVSVRALYDWLHADPDFETAYREARREAVTQAIARLQQSASDAVTVLQDVMADDTERGQTRIAAARIVLETAIKAVELEDLAARVEQLERAFNDDAQKTSHPFGSQGNRACLGT